MSKNPSKTNQTEPDFESAMQQLEALVEHLESGELGLAESMSHFEQGIRLSKQCHALLEHARQSIEVLSDPEDESSASAIRLSEDENRNDDQTGDQ
ncbi:MAG: exodeoxyribonuclease VII small subunit, partial [Wenzhouxiangellaceae bacterium]